MPKTIDVRMIVDVRPEPDLPGTHAIINLVTEDGPLLLKISRGDASDLAARLRTVWQATEYPADTD